MIALRPTTTPFEFSTKKFSIFFFARGKKKFFFNEKNLVHDMIPEEVELMEKLPIFEKNFHISEFLNFFRNFLRKI